MLDAAHCFEMLRLSAKLCGVLIVEVALMEMGRCSYLVNVLVKVTVVIQYITLMLIARLRKTKKKSMQVGKNVPRLKLGTFQIQSYHFLFLVNYLLYVCIYIYMVL